MSARPSKLRSCAENGPVLTTSPPPIPLPAGAHVELQHDVDVVGQQRDLDSAPQAAQAEREHGLPQLQYVVRTSYCDIGFQLSQNGERAVIVSCLDNLLKGASSQAVQNLNLMYGWDEAEGLE